MKGKNQNNVIIDNYESINGNLPINSKEKLKEFKKTWQTIQSSFKIWQVLLV